MQSLLQTQSGRKPHFSALLTPQGQSEVKSYVIGSSEHHQTPQTCAELHRSSQSTGNTALGSALGVELPQPGKHRASPHESTLPKCLPSAKLSPRETHHFPKLSYLLATGEKRGLGHVGHQRQVQSFNVVPMSSRHPPARGAHACLCSGRQGRSCRAYSKCRRRRLPGNNRNKEGAIFELVTCISMEIKLMLTRGPQAVLREQRHRALLYTSTKSLPYRKLFALPKGHCSK